MTSLTRRAVLGAVVAAGLAPLACSRPQSTELTPAQIMQKSSSALGTVTSVHFTLASTNGKMAVGSGLAVQSIEGDVVKPDRLKANATGSFGSVTVDVGMIQVGTHQYITNPITKRWQEVPGAQPAPNLLDPRRGAPAILQQATQLKKLGNETIQGTDCYHLTGKIAAAPIAGLLGTTATTDTLDGDVWIGTKDFLVRQISLTGPITTGEPPKIQRVLSLSRFNEAMTIDAPTTG